MAFFPKPPIRNMTDFVVFAFVTIVVAMLALGTIGLFVLAITDSSRDLSAIFKIYTDITNSLISALIGFLAGKGQGRADLHEELQEMKREEEKEP